MGRGIHVFNAAKVAEARNLVEQGGLSDAALAKHFGCGRSSIIRMRQREGIDSAIGQGMPGRDGRKLDAPMLNAMRKRLFGAPPKITDPTELRPAAWASLGDAKPISLMDLPDRPGVLCRWPVTGGYCGLPSGDRTYCSDHHKMAFRQPTEGEIRTEKSVKKMGHK